MSRALQRTKNNWEALARRDPLWSVLAHDGKQGAWHEDEFFEMGRMEVEALWAQIASVGVIVPEDRAFDFGCGVGRLSRFIAERCARVDGVDISEAMIAEANRHRRYPDRCFFHQYDGEGALPFDAETFGFVTSLLTLQHVPPEDAARYLGELARVVRPGGVLAVQMPSRRTPQRPGALAGARQWARRLVDFRLLGRPHMEMHAADPGEVHRILTRSGLTVVGAVPDGRAGSWGESMLHVAVRR